MDIRGYSRKDIGNLGEQVAAEYLRRRGFAHIRRNMRVKIGELDIVARKDDCLHVVEVKALSCESFPTQKDSWYDPGQNLHTNKIRKLVRAARWYVADIGWEGEWQIDGALVWLRLCDGMAHIEYYPQIL